MHAILKCNCKSEFQDKEYGPQMRLHNLGQGKGKGKAYCTVCCTNSREKKIVKDVTPQEHKNFGVTFSTIAQKARVSKQV